MGTSLLDTIAIATTNKGKIAEFDGYLRTLGLTMFQGPKLSFPPEDGATYFENAAIKGRHGAKEWKVPCVGEDSGIEVVGLGNLPGSRSSRFSLFSQQAIAKAIKHGTLAGCKETEEGPKNLDQANNDKILQCLAGMKGDKRIFRYVASLVLAAPDGALLYAEQACVTGRILEAPKGSGGFGFDPIAEFLDFPGRSVAELTMDEKNLVSHRGRVMQYFLEWLGRQHA